MVQRSQYVRLHTGVSQPFSRGPNLKRATLYFHCLALQRVPQGLELLAWLTISWSQFFFYFFCCFSSASVLAPAVEVKGDKDEHGKGQYKKIRNLYARQGGYKE